MVYLSVGCGDLCLQIHLSVRWLWVMFAMGFVSSLVGGYVCYWVCLFVGWGLCLVFGLSDCWLCDNIISFNSRDGVSVGLFYYRFKAIPWILNYKWADYWPYWEFSYLFFFLCGLLLLCVLPWVICFMVGVVWVLGFFLFFLFVLKCYVLAGEFEQLAAK